MPSISMCRVHSSHVERDREREKSSLRKKQNSFVLIETFSADASICAPVAFYGESVDIHQSTHTHSHTLCAQAFVDLVIFHTDILIQFNHCILIHKFAVQNTQYEIINIRLFDFKEGLSCLFLFA